MELLYTQATILLLKGAESLSSACIVALLLPCFGGKLATKRGKRGYAATCDGYPSQIAAGFAGTNGPSFLCGILHFAGACRRLVGAVSRFRDSRAVPLRRDLWDAAVLRLERLRYPLQ